RRDYPTYEPLRIALGQTRRFAARMDLNAVTPHDEFASSRYCLANPGSEYLVYIPDDDRVDLYLGIEARRYTVEWFNVLTGETLTGDPVLGGGTRHFTSPFGLESVLYLQAMPL
ncbi:MAG TPA: hypothetical protein PKE45_17120, partial [Caldilineaceae bacterium]|nr:hypothetical protein [Caldilineaceae bacterium]